MVNYRKIFLTAFTFLITLDSIAQTANVSAAKEENGFMRSEGKIYVVMVVVITILVGLIYYVSRLDRKLSKLEKGEHS
jgi:flagellar biogenesis protein FliO